MRSVRAVASVTALLLCGGAGIWTATDGRALVGVARTQNTSAITVVMTDFRFKLSRTKKVPVGKVVFKLVNKGNVPHNFRINGKTSKLIAPGKTGRLIVSFKRKGVFAYKCTVPGHAKLGMKGALGVGTSNVPTTTATSTTTTTTTTTTGSPCAAPKSTTVNVSMVDFAFQFSQTMVPCGTVSFIVKNNGLTAHDLVFSTLTNAATPLLNPGASSTLVVNFTNSGSFGYVCDVPGHDRLGMIGTLTVTP